MNTELFNFAARLRQWIGQHQFRAGEQPPSPEFNSLALALFSLQFQGNAAYRKICEARALTPQSVTHWTQIPAVPTSAFKELELTSLAPGERPAVFHSSGTTEQKPSRHFHSAESLALYEASLWPWFVQNCGLPIADCKLICLTPPPEQVPHSSLVHMFETIWQKSSCAGTLADRSPFFGKIDKDGTWTLDFEAVLAALAENPQSAIGNPQLLVGTAFSFVHLLDFLAEKNLLLKLPPGSRVMETGGYKNRSRTMPKAELHVLIEKFLGVPRENILCEYGMSELSSQAYSVTEDQGRGAGSSAATHYFHFPPWARVQIISPETGNEVGEGETGLIRIFDLANVWSVAAIQTEDLGVRRGGGFELIGRAALAESRGCSLNNAEN
ncbi:MAG TPA: hypothetical protein VGO57_03890 [Verrucomicrobiae bacterium]